MNTNPTAGAILQKNTIVELYIVNDTQVTPGVTPTTPPNTQPSPTATTAPQPTATPTAVPTATPTAVPTATTPPGP